MVETQQFIVHFASQENLNSFKRRLARFVQKGLRITDCKRQASQAWDPNRDATWAPLWHGMPEYINLPGIAPWKSFVYTVDGSKSVDLFKHALNQRLWETKTENRGYWFPPRPRRKQAHKCWETQVQYRPRYPIYIISKGRWHKQLTARALDAMGVDYSVVVEPHEKSLYQQAINPKKILVLPFKNLGQGSIPARNWVWEHSKKTGNKRHWILDDNMPVFWRRNRNEKLKCRSGNIFRAVEDWVDRYTNIGLAGLNYQQFVIDQLQIAPITLNTRIYSCILVNNSMTHRWRGKYNEDTDLSLRVLKDGMCTALFNAFLVTKMPTMTMDGGNTHEVYHQGKKRKEFAESLQKQHPDVVQVTRRFQRWHHLVNYRPFKSNRLKPSAIKLTTKRVNPYGMILISKCQQGPDDAVKPSLLLPERH